MHAPPEQSVPPFSASRLCWSPTGTAGKNAVFLPERSAQYECMATACRFLTSGIYTMWQCCAVLWRGNGRLSSRLKVSDTTHRKVDGLVLVVVGEVLARLLRPGAAGITGVAAGVRVTRAEEALLADCHLRMSQSCCRCSCLGLPSQQ